MDDHAKEIWEAWTDGRTVEFNIDVNNWIEQNPNEISVSKQPQNAPHDWRIKNEKINGWARMYLDRHIVPELVVCKSKKYLEDTSYDLEDRKSFVEWLTDWIPY